MERKLLNYDIIKFRASLSGLKRGALCCSEKQSSLTIGQVSGCLLSGVALCDALLLIFDKGEVESGLSLRWGGFVLKRES